MSIIALNIDIVRISMAYGFGFAFGMNFVSLLSFTPPFITSFQTTVR
jgi:hypothetical protein